MPGPTGDADQQDAAEADVEKFRANLGPFVVAAEKTRMAMVFTNAKEPENPIIFANDAFVDLFGYSREEVLGGGFNAMMARGADPDALAQIEAEFAGTSDGEPEIRYRRSDGSEFWASVFVSPVCDESGDILQYFASFVDHSLHREEQSRCAMLIDELNHRVKNTLSTVQSIVRQAVRNTTERALVRDSIESRIFALARSHDLLTQDNWQGAGLHDLIDAALEPFDAVNGRTERFTVIGPNIRLLPKATLALGIAFHELATNAVKYGALSNDAGTIHVEWATARKRLVLLWTERGGPPVVPPSRRGFGSQVLERGLAHELDGKVQLDYQPEGVVCTIDIPSPRGSGDE